MPIARTEFDKGEMAGSPSSKIKKYLSDHNTEAFTLDELVQALEDPQALKHFWQRDQIANVYSDSLLLMAANGEIKANVVSTPIGLATYFSANKA